MKTKSISWIRKRYYELRYGFKMKRDYNYKRIGFAYIFVYEHLCNSLQQEGWERITDPLFWMGNGYVWFERKKTTL